MNPAYYLVLFVIGISIMHYYSGYVIQAEQEYEQMLVPHQGKIMFGMTFVISGMMIALFSILKAVDIAEKLIRHNLKEVKQKCLENTIKKA